MSISAVTSGSVQTPSPAPAPASSTSVFGEIWDTINPLQHIPIVSSLYRSATDTSISSFANIAGSTIYGGPIGGAIAAAEEGVSAIGSAIFGDSKTQTAAAVTTPTAPLANTSPNSLAPAAGATTAKPAHAHHHHKLHATTQEWLYQNATDSDDSDDPIDTADINPTISNTASASYKKIQSLTTDWLKPAPAQTNDPKTV